MKALMNATKAQLDILIEHHTRTLTTIEYQIEHSTDHEQATNIIRITDNIGDKYTKRHLMKNTRSHKNTDKNRSNDLEPTVQLLLQPMPTDQLTTLQSPAVYSRHLHNTTTRIT